MTASDFRGPALYDGDPDVSEFVERYYSFVFAIARKEVPLAIGPVDSEDVAQEAMSKLLLILEKRSIRFPAAYIRRIVHSVVIDMVRKYKPDLYQALPTDEDGEEIQDGYLRVSAGMEVVNPETIVEQKEEVDECMTELMAAMSKLYPRQQYAAVCTLKDRVDDLIQLVEALQRNCIDSDVQWPEEKTERQRLQSSYSAAKRNIAQCMNINLPEY